VKSLKNLPWSSLCLAAVLAVITIKAIDFILGQSVARSENASAFMNLFVTPAGSILLLLCGGLAMGILGVLYLEQFSRMSPIYGSVLWALAFCLLIGSWLASFLPTSGLGLAQISRFQIMSMMVGVFWKGRAYWSKF
jgi:hypothetical protein